MTAIVSGNGLGLFNTSLTQLGGTLGDLPGLGQGTTSQYFNVVNGGLILQGRDESLLARGLLVDYTRTYNSRGVLANQAQAGQDLWTFEFESTVRLTAGTLNASGSSLVKTLADGSQITFDFDASRGLYVSTAGDGAHDTISYSATSKSYTWTDGSSLRQEVFDTQGRISIIRDAKTGAQNTVERDTQGRVTRVTGAGGTNIEVSYGDNSMVSGVRVIDNGTVVSACRYTYNSSRRLDGIIVDLTPGSAAARADGTPGDNWADNANGLNTFATRYEYSPETGKLKRAERGIGQSDGFEVTYDYYDDDRLKSILIGNAADGSAQLVTFTYQAGATSVTDQAGRTWTYQYDSKGQLTDILSPAENGQRQLTHIEYDAAGNVTRVVDAENRETVYRYDANGNCVYQRDNAGNTLQRTFDARNQVQTQTVFTVADPDGNGPQLASGALTVRNVYDAQERLAYTIGASGEVTQYRYDAVSGLVAASVTFDTQRYSLAGLATDAVPSLSTMDSWAANALAQKVDGAPVISRTEYRYDARGLLTTKTAFATVDASGAGVADAAASVSVYTYDASGRLRAQSTQRNGRVVDTLTYNYDGLGRLVSTTDAGGATTTYVNNDAGQALVVTQATGLVRSEAYDKAGQVIAVTQSAVGDAQSARVERRFFDGAGRLRGSQDAAGGRTYYFYDAAGRMTAQVDPTGAVTEYRRDRTGKLLSTCEYATRVDTTSWLASGKVTPERIEAVRPAAAAADRVTTNTYDAAGRLATQTDAEGTVTTYSYDGASRLVQVSVGRPADGAAAQRVTRYFLDASGRTVGTLDAEGYLVEHRYDAAGREVALVRYARATDPALRASAGLDALRPPADSHDQVTRSFYNARDLKVGELDAEGYFTEFVYDEAQNQRALRRFATALTGLGGDESFAALRTRAQTGAVRETRMAYDGRGLLTRMVDAEGTATTYSYDAGGRLIQSVRGAGTADARAATQRVNAFGEVVAELNGEGSALLTPGMATPDVDALYARFGIRHTYDALGRRIESVDAEGNKTWYFYDAASRLTRTVRGVQDEAGVRNALGEITEARYDTFGDVIETVAYSDRVALAPPYGRAQADAALTVAWYLNAVASHQAFAFDRDGRMTASADADNVRRSYGYNAFGDRLSDTVEVAPGRFIATTYRYDRRGLLVQTTEAGARTTTQEVDAFGRVVAAGDGMNRSTRMEYDRLGRQVSTTDRLGNTFSTRYDAYGRTLVQLDAVGNATSYAYDDVARSVVVRTAEGVTLRTEHNAHGETVRVVDAAGVETRYLYDHDGHLLQTQDAAGTARQQYDARGLLSRSVDASGRAVSYRYDAAGRMLERVEDPSEAGHAGLDLRTVYRYDGQGRQVRVTDPAGVTSKMTYDAAGQLIELVRDEGGLALRTTYAWDGLGRQLLVTDAAGTPVERRTRFGYDDLGRRTSETVEGADLHLTTFYAYDANDNLVQRIDAEGRVTRMAYDADDRCVLEVDADGGVVQHGFDVNGREISTRAYVNRIDLTGLAVGASPAAVLARLVADDARDVRSYSVLDRDGRAALVIDGAGGVTQTRFDAAGRVVSTRTFAQRLALTDDVRAQLGAGALRPEGVALPAASTQDRVEYRSYDAAGRLRYRIAGTGDVTRFDYDAAGRVVGTVSFIQRVAAQVSTEAEVDAQLRPTAGDVRTYTVYDGAGRARYSVDAAGNVEALYVDADGRTVGSRRFAHPIAIAGLEAGLRAGTATPQAIEAALVADDAHDVRTYQVLDALGRVRFTVDGAGAVQEFTLNAQGEVTAIRRLATPIALTPGLVAALGAGTERPAAFDALLTRDATRDPREIRMLDGVGRLRYAIHANGAVDELRYDATGKVVATLSYAAPLSADTLAQVASGSMTLDAMGALLLPQQAAARMTRAVYDSAGQARFALTRLDDGTFAVEETRYDGAGQVTRQVRYGVAVAATGPLTDAGVQAALAAAGGSAAARTTSFAYDAAGQQVFMVDAAGAVTQSVRDGAGRVVESRAYDTTVAPGTSDVATLGTALAGAGSRVTRTVYDAAGQVSSTIDALGHAEFFEYNGAGEKTAYVNRDGNRWTYAYDAAGRLQRETSPQVTVAGVVDGSGTLDVATRNVVTAFEYDGLGNVTARVEDADGAARRTEYGYDARGRQVLTVFPDAGEWNAAAGTFTATGRPTTRVLYDALDRAVVQTDVQGYCSYRVYDTAGELRYEVDAEGYVTGYTYDAFGEQVSLTRYARTVSVPDGQPLAVADVQARLAPDPNNDRTLTTRYSARGEKLEVQQDAVMWYDAAGTAFQSRPTTRFTYDVYGQLARESVLLEGDANAANAQWADTTHYYDAAGRQIAQVDAENYLTTFAYSAQGDLLSQTEYAQALAAAPAIDHVPVGVASNDAAIGFDRTTVYSYDALGRKTGERVHRHVADQEGRASDVDVLTTIGYDNEGHATDVTVGSLATHTVYDALGRAIAVREPERQVVVSDVAARLQAVGARLGDAANADTVATYSRTRYDAFGNVVELRRFAHGVHTGEGEPSESSQDQVQLNRFDRQGRSVWERDAAGTVYERAYDAADHVLSSRMRLDGSAARWAWVTTRASYDRLGRQVASSVERELHRGDASPATATVVDTASFVRYNAFGEIVAKADDAAGLDTAGQHVTFDYDRAGRLIFSDAEAGIARAYGYDLAGRQVRETHETLLDGSYQQGITIASRSATAVTLSLNDRLGRTVAQRLPTASDSAEASVLVQRRYDRWGNVLEVVDPRGGHTTYQYNEQNQATLEVRPRVKVVGADGAEVMDAPTTRWYYDALGRQVGMRDANNVLHRNRFDGAGQLIQAVDGSGGVTTHGYDALGNEVYAEDADGHVTYKAFDAAGRVVEHGDYLTRADGTARNRTRQETYRLDSNGNRVEVTDALGNTVRYDYDSRGLLVRSRTAAGVVMEYAYDRQGHKVRETNALSDASLLQEPTPVYQGGLPPEITVREGQANVLEIPDNLFQIDTGDVLSIREHVTVEHWNETTHQYEAASGWSFDAGTRRLTFALGQTGIYRVLVAGSTEVGTTATGATQVTVLDDAAWNQLGWNTRPQAVKGLAPLLASAGGAFEVHLPAGMFNSPTGRPMTYRWLVKQAHREFEPDESGGGPASLVATRVSGHWVTVWDWVELGQSALAATAFVDPDTGTLRATLPDHAISVIGTSVELAVVATCDGVDSVEAPITVGQRINTTLPVRRQAVDAAGQPVVDSLGHPVYLDEQTWAYDVFGRVIDHHDLGGVGYTYAYDATTQQQTGQASGWTLNGQVYSTPVRDYRTNTGDYDWNQAIEDALRRWNELDVPSSPELLSDPQRTIAYYANGQIKRIQEGWNWSAYTYDANGNRTSEESLTHVNENEVLHVRTQVTYDAQNRIIGVTQDDLGNGGRRLLDLRYDYDAVGNRRRVVARGAYGDGQSPIATTDLPPVTTGIANQAALAGEAWTFQLPAGTFTDPEGGPLSYLVTMQNGDPAPAWIHFDSFSRTFTGTPPAVGEFALRVTVHDIDGHEVSADFTLQALDNLPPQVQGSIDAQLTYLGAQWSFGVPTGVFVDPEGRALHYTATLADGSPLPSWLTVSDDGMFSGVPTIATGYRIHVVATDSVGATAAVDFDLTVAQQAEPFNPNFEEGDTGWDKQGNWRIEAGGGTPYGTWKAVDYSYGDNLIINKVRVPVVAGQSVSASCEYAQGAADAWDNWGAVALVWFDAEGNRLSTTQGNSIGSSSGGNNGWHTSSVTATAPAGAAYASVAGFSHKSDSRHSVMFDRFTLVAAPAPATTDGSIPTQYATEGQPWFFTIPASSRTGKLSYRTVIAAEDAGWLSFKTPGDTLSGTPPVSGTRHIAVQTLAYSPSDGWYPTDETREFDLVVAAAGAGGGGGSGGGVITDPGTVTNAQFVSSKAMFAQLMMTPTPGDGDGGWGGSPGNHTDPYDAPSDYKSYWFSYDADNRVQVVNGELANGEIVMSRSDISYALSYDAAGRATQRRFWQGATTSFETTLYTERGERQTLVLDGGVTEKFIYDADGRAIQHLQYYTAASGKGDAAIGMLKHAEIYTFDADGRVLRQDVYGRPMNWTPPVWTPPSDPNSIVDSSGAGAPVLNPTPSFTASFEGSIQAGNNSYFTLPADCLRDPDGGALKYSLVSGPAGATVEPSGVALDPHDQLYIMYAAPAGALTHDVTVRVRATDDQGQWSDFLFTITVEGREPDEGGRFQSLMFAPSVVANPVEPDPTRELSLIGIVNYGPGAYDQAGRLTAYTYSSIALEDGARAGDPTGFRQTFVYQYEARESYLEKQVNGYSNNTNFRATNTYSEYDAWGRRTAVREQTPKFDKRDQMDDRVRYFTYDREGMILQRREGTLASGTFNAETSKEERYAFVGGQQVARGTRGGELDVVGRLTAYQATGTGEITLTVQAGDTLRSIAQRVYGNSNLWYVLAEANSLSDQQLVEGNQIRVPDIKVTANDSATFKPYNPAETVGNTTPNLPYITPPPKHHCNALAMILIIVVAVVVSVVTYGAMSEFMAGWVGASATTTAMVAGAAAGAAGAAASGVMSSVLGVGSFSWKNVALGAVTGAATGAFASAAKLGMVSDALQNSEALRAAAGAAVGNLTSYAASRALGLPAQFNWANVAISAVAAGVGSGAGSRIASSLAIEGTFGRTLTESLTGGLAGAELHHLHDGGKINYASVAMDAFGNAIATMAAYSILGASGTAMPSSASIERAGGPAGEGDAAWSGVRLNPYAAPGMRFARYIDGGPTGIAPAGEPAPEPRTLATVEVHAIDSPYWAQTMEWARANNSSLFARMRETSWRRDYNRVAAQAGYKYITPDMSAIQARAVYRGSAAVYGAAEADYQRAYGPKIGPIPEPTGLQRLKSFAENYTPGGIAKKMLTHLLDESAVALGMGRTIEDPNGMPYRVAPISGEWMDPSQVQDAKFNLFTSLATAGVASEESLALREIKAQTVELRGVAGTDGLRRTSEVASTERFYVARSTASSEGVGIGGFGGAYPTNGELVQSIATRADNWGVRQGLGNGPVAGTLKHGYAETLLNRYQRMFEDRGLSAEARYVNGNPWRAGDPIAGSIRLDVVEGPHITPTYVWDYKFGNARLSRPQISRIQNGIPNGANVPITMVKP